MLLCVRLNLVSSGEVFSLAGEFQLELAVLAVCLSIGTGSTGSFLPCERLLCILISSFF